MLELEIEPSDRSRLWDYRAAALLERALSEVRGSEDAMPTVGAALDALRIAVGELDENELDCMFQDPEDRCICPPELQARGGFRGGCPVHNSY